MNWILLALLAPAIYTIVNFLDKYIVSNKVRDYRAMPIYGTIVALIVGTIFWIITGFPILGIKDALIVIFTGMLTIWAALLYFKALSKEETTMIIILMQLTPVISLILAFFLLNETILPKQFIGFFVILTSVTIASLKPTKKKLFNLSSAFFLMLIVSVMWSLSGVLIKFAISANSFSEILSYESWGLGLGGVILFLLFPNIRNAFIKSFKSLKKETLSFLFINEFIFVLAKGITFLAYVSGPVALVSVLGGTQVFFGIIYGTILTILFPKNFKEDIKRNSLLRKAILASFVLAGILLLS